MANQPKLYTVLFQYTSKTTGQLISGSVVSIARTLAEAELGMRFTLMSDENPDPYDPSKPVNVLGDEVPGYVVAEIVATFSPVTVVSADNGPWFSLN